MEELATFDAIDSRLQGHPDMTALPGLDMSTGSLGQGLSPGIGMALGARLGGHDFHTWVILGDGEIQEGQIWEAAFVASRYRLSNLTAIVDYNRLPQFGWPDASGFTRDEPIGDPGAKFAAFGWNVVETDGHDHEALTAAFDAAVAYIDWTDRDRRPHHQGQGCLVHGERLQLARHSSQRPTVGGRRRRASGSPVMISTASLLTTESRSVGLREAWGEQLVSLGNTYPNLVVLDGDLANSTKADMFAAAHPDRFFEMGIAEQNMLGVAAGLATTGYVPWISTFAAFVAKRALDQIRVVIAQPSLNVKMCGAYSGILTSKTGKTHQSVEDLAVFRAMPHVVTIVPADAVELQAAMAAMMEDDRPTYLRVTRDATPVIFDAGYTFEIGKAHLLREGADVGIISTGVQTVRALEAAHLLQEHGISASVLHVPTLKPLDTDAICALAASDRRHRHCRGSLDHWRLGQRRCRNARRESTNANAADWLARHLR